MSTSSRVASVGVERPPGRRRDDGHGQAVEERAERPAIVAQERVHDGAGDRRADGEREHARGVDLERGRAGGRIGVDGGREQLEHRGHEVRHVAAHDDRGRVVAPVDVGEGDEARREPGQRSAVGDGVAHHRHLVRQGRRHGWRQRRPAR